MYYYVFSGSFISCRNFTSLTGLILSIHYHNYCDLNLISLKTKKQMYFTTDHKIYPGNNK